MILRSKNEIISEVLSRSVSEVILRDHLEPLLRSGKKLRIKFGIDPTAPDLHLGHTVALRKLRLFQDLGHTIILIIGDFTAMIGDPSGRNQTRVPLGEKEVSLNMKRYLKQAGKIINVKKTEVRYNSAWYKKKNQLIYELTSRVSLQRSIERDDFEKRLAGKEEITILEVLYPLLQGYDSVVVSADIEIGGSDQKFNMLMGRRLQRSYGLGEQDIITLDLIPGTDGHRKMSKSYGNAIGLEESPNNIFGKIMSIPDSLIIPYARAFTSRSLEDVADDEKKIQSGHLHPKDAKMMLAKEIISLYHSAKKADEAEKFFVRVFQQKEVPSAIPEVIVKKDTTLLGFLRTFHASASNSEARRLISGGGVRVDDTILKDEKLIISKEFHGRVLRVGKRHFYKIRVQ